MLINGLVGRKTPTPPPSIDIIMVTKHQRVLMEAFGIVPKQRALPKLKECPNVTCKELNAPDAPFCVKCRIPLTVVAHIEEGHRKDQELQDLRKQLADLVEQQQGFDMKLKKLLHIVDQTAQMTDGEGPWSEVTDNFLGEEIVKMMSQPTTKVSMSRRRYSSIKRYSSS